MGARLNGEAELECKLSPTLADYIPEASNYTPLCIGAPVAKDDRHRDACSRLPLKGQSQVVSDGMAH